MYTQRLSRKSNGRVELKNGTISGNTNANTGGGNDGGGGVYKTNNTSTFRIVTGTIYGTNAVEESLRNTISGGLYAALYGIGERGTFTGPDGEWEPKGTQSYMNSTLKVLNGNLE